MYFGASWVAQLVKNPPAMQETWVQPLVGEDPLEEGMAAHSSILAWRIQRTEESDRLWSTVSQRGASLVAQTVKRLPAVRETWV